MTRRPGRKSLLAVIVVLVTAVSAWAFYSVAGGGTGSGTVGSLSAATISVPSNSTGSHAITWTAQASASSNSSAIKYTVERKLGSGSFAAIATGPCSGQLPHGTSSCTDTVGASGNYTYRVIAKLGGWTATSNEAGPVNVTIAPSDSTAPSLTSLEMFDTTGNGKVDQVKATFNETIQNSTATSPWTLANVPSGDSLASVSTSGAVATLTLTEGSGTATTAVGSFTVALAADSAGIRDAAGNQSSFAATAPADKAAPIVTAITRSGSSPTNAASVNFGVSFSESVTGVTSDDFALGAGAPTGASIGSGAVSGSGASYTVSVNTGTGTSGTIQLALSDDDSIVDSATPANKLGGPGHGNGDFTGTQTYAIDKSAPSVSSIVRGSPTAATTNASSVDFTVTFSESVDTVVAGDFALAGTLATASITGVSGTGATRTVSVATGAGSGTLRLDLSDSNNSVKDAAGNAVTPSTFTTGASYTIDHTAPSVSSIVRGNPTAATTNASSVDFTVTFSESVETVAAGDFAFAGTLRTGSITSVTGSGATRTVSVSTGAGSGTLRLDLNDSNNSITDTAGNAVSPNTYTTGDAYTIDRTAPSVSSISRVGNEFTNTTGSVQWTVTFSENVATVVAGDFALAGSSSGGSIAGVAGSGATRTVTVNTGGEGTLRLDLNDSNNSIKDAAGNAVTPNTFTGEPYTIDRTAPTLTTLQMFDTNATPDGKIDEVDATFTESLASYSAPNSVWTLANMPGGSSNTLSGVSVTGDTATLTLSTTGGVSANTSAGTWSGTTFSPFTVALTANANGIRDAAGNQASFAATNVTDKAAPVSTLSFTRSSNNDTPSAGDKINVAFTEPLAVNAMCQGGTAWTGNTSDQSLTGDGDVSLRIENNTAPSTSNDRLVVQAINNGKCNGGRRFGTVDLGSNAYVSAAQDAAASGASRSKITWTFSNRTLVFELGTITANAVTPSVTATWAPTSGMADLAGNAPLSGSDTGNKHF